jgi:hypothetical protein
MTGNIPVKYNTYMYGEIKKDTGFNARFGDIWHQHLRFAPKISQIPQKCPVKTCKEALVLVILDRKYVSQRKPRAVWA